jgi:HSP20 family molecular chaperone IbpA
MFSLYGLSHFITGLPAKQDMSNSVRSELIENPETFALVIDAPGVSPDSIELTVSDRAFQLVLHSHSDVPTGAEPRSIERSTAERKISGRFRLPIDLEGVTAKLDQGVLSMVFPKVATPQSKRIAINAH